jgi:HAD superfamily hydrolase (TIGR01549 family)
MAQILIWSPGFSGSVAPWSSVKCSTRKQVESFLMPDSVILLSEVIAREHRVWLALCRLACPRTIMFTVDSSHPEALPPFVQNVSSADLPTFLRSCVHRIVTDIDPRSLINETEAFLSPNPICKAVFFDNDGTLTDSEDFTLRAIQGVLRAFYKEHGISRRIPSKPQILAMLGVKLGTLYPQLTPPEFSEALDEITTRCREEIHRRIPEGRLFPGTEEVLTRLHEAGYKLGLVSTSTPAYFGPITRQFGLERSFDAMLCLGERPGKRKSDLILELKQRWNIGEAWMVGDRSVDIEAGMESGCKTVGCLYGCGKKGEVSNASYTIKSIEELLPIILG